MNLKAAICIDAFSSMVHLIEWIMWNCDYMTQFVMKIMESKLPRCNITESDEHLLKLMIRTTLVSMTGMISAQCRAWTWGSDNQNLKSSPEAEHYINQTWKTTVDDERIMIGFNNYNRVCCVVVCSGICWWWIRHSLMRDHMI